MALETELKFAISSEHALAFPQHPFVQAISKTHKTQQMMGIYFDTPTHDLQKAGIGLRVRQEGNQWVQALKTAGKVVDGLHQRQEWEVEVSDGQLNISAFPADLVQRYFNDAQINQRLEALFCSDFTRQSWQWQQADNHVELCLDQGSVRSGTASEPISEVELELKAGNLQTLLDIATDLEKTLNLKAENISKAQRGYAVYLANKANSHD
jgi:triphosphatase